MTETIGLVTDVLVAVGALLALSGAGAAAVYVARRRQNGQAPLPGSAHDELVNALDRGFEKIDNRLKDNAALNSKEHRSQMHALGFKEGHHWVPNDEKRDTIDREQAEGG